MKYTDEGLELAKAEIIALLAFASEDPESKFYGVTFRLHVDRVRARATNGHIALDALGANETDRAWEWFVHRDFLKRASKVLDNTDKLRLRFSGVSLHEADVIDKDGNQRSTFSWPHDAASAQHSFPDSVNWDHLLTPPTGKRAVKFVTINAQYIALLAKVAAAAEVQGIDCYPPPRANEHCVYRAEGAEVTWVAVIMPMRSDSKDQSVDEAAADFSQTVQEAADATGATISMTLEGEKPIVLAEPKKGRKAK